MSTDTRYPFTYAYDYVRALAGYDRTGTKISRADAAGIVSGIATALEKDRVELAEDLANYYQVHKEEICKDSTDAILRVLQGGEF